MKLVDIVRRSHLRLGYCTNDSLYADHHHALVGNPKNLGNMN
jgi:hypothetical protein